MKFNFARVTDKLILLISGFYLLAYLLPSYNFSYRFGLNADLVNNEGYLGYLRFFSLILVHGGFLHILFNMISLYNIGVILEYILGTKKYIYIIILLTFLSSLSVFLFGNRGALTIGASGLIFGLLGVLLTLKTNLSINKNQLYFMTALNIFLTFSFPGISWQAHIGGLISGAITGYVLSNK